MTTEVWILAMLLVGLVSGILNRQMTGRNKVSVEDFKKYTERLDTSVAETTCQERRAASDKLIEIELRAIHKELTDIQASLKTLFAIIERRVSE